MRKLQEPEKVGDEEMGRWGDERNSSPSSSSQSKIQNSPPYPRLSRGVSKIEMPEPTTASTIAYAIALLRHYKFELRGYTAEELVNLWLRRYPTNWVRLGVIEALYQGRYKAVSVEQILSVWTRRGQVTYRFNREFERLISRKLPQNLTLPLEFQATDLIEEYNLQPLTPSTDDSMEGQTKLEAIADNPTATDKQDSPPITTAFEDVTEMSLQPNHQPPEVLSSFGASPTYDTDWSRCELKKQPIHQFTPPPDSSDFFLKLKAVVQHQELSSGKVRTSLIDQNELEPPGSGSNKN